MAGKAYTMREMRAIVEYLTEHKAYGEIRGRKMWMEFANSKHTARTWQSLKETFLKRILPDLHNPYYKLSMDQVRSFRQGYDVAEREKNNRLEFRTASEGSSTNAESQNEDVQTKTQPDDTTAVANEPSTSIDKEVENATGEDITSAKIQSRNRSSADTVVLEYENAEEVLRVLESPNNDRDEPKTKSFKDLLTFEYSAPLTPIVRELLDDFETESETSDKEPGLKIVEPSSENTEQQEKVVENTTPQQIAIENTLDNNANDKVESATGTQDTENADIIQMEAEESADVIKDTSLANDTAQKDVQGKSESQQNESNTHKESEEKHIEDNNNDESVTPQNNKESNVQNNDVPDFEHQNNTEFVTALESSNDKTFETLAICKKGKEMNTTICNMASSTQNTGNTSSDTLLPNNQEALDNSKNTNDDKTADNAKKVENNEKRSDKRKASQDSRESKKQKTSETTTNETKIHEGNIPAEVIEIDLDTQNTSRDNNETLMTDVIVINTDTPTNNTEEVSNAQLNIVSTNSDRTNKTKKGLSMNEDKKIEKVKEKVIEKDEDTNLCLQTVSLFDEQFKNTKYSDSDSDDEATPAPKVIESKGKQYQVDINEEKVTECKQVVQKKNEMQDMNDVKKDERTIESSGECQQRRQSVILTKQIQNKAASLQRERALANVFGFSHGAAASNNRKRRLSHRRRSHHQYHHHHSKNMDSNSSEWTSESDTESYISPPRGRRNRQTRKYLKPKSSRILQAPDEGMLYVIFGKNIYPLVKDGKHIKNFLTYRPDSGSDMEEESYWKQKYVDEKKRVDEYKKLMKKARENRKSPHINESTSPRSPIFPTTTSRKSTNSQTSGKSEKNGNGKELVITSEVENKMEAKNDKMVLKIASKNGLECCLEGGWNQISNAMPQMVRMLQNKSPSPNKETMPPLESNKMEVEVQTSQDEALESSSGVATAAIDPEVHEKINKIETEIFKEIEMREMEEQDNENETSNVTKRKPGRPRKGSSASSISTPRSPLKARVSKKSSIESKQVVTKPKNTRNSKQKLEVPVDTETKPDTEKPTTRIRTKTKTLTETKDQKQMNPVDKKNVEKLQNDIIVDQKRPVRRESLRISKQKEASEHNNSIADSDASPVGMRSSTRNKATPKKYDTDSSTSDIRLRSRKSASKETTALLGFDDEEARFMFPPTATPKNSKTSPKGKRIRSLPEINVISPKDVTQGNSIDSSQGYQDSDVSPIDQVPKRKRKISLLTRKKYKNRRVSRRKSYPTLLQDLSSDSNNSSYFVPLKRSQSTLNSEVYKTDSYRLLLPKQKHSFNVLDVINEDNPMEQQLDRNMRHFNSVSKDSDLFSNDNPNIVEINSSSNISLPISPELSVVEKLSLSREMIKNECHPNLNEVQLNEGNHEMDFSEYMISNLDVSMPLMNQQCNIRNKNKVTPKNPAKLTTSSDPLLNKVCAVRVENLTLSESLNQRLRDLLLESNKKVTRANSRKVAKKVGQLKATVDETNAHNTKEDAMDVDEITTVSPKKTKAKRSSTPRKKKTSSKAKIPKGSVIEEEHRESCSYGGRKSCPPAVTFIPIDENANNCSDVTLNVEKAKKKKDVIKVKIQRPKSRNRSREKMREKSVGNASSVSIYTDSGINDTETISGVFLKGSDDSVDLIHNHSETCLLANECIGDSLELIENTKSIISVDSSIESMDSELKRLLEDTANTSRELLSTTNTKNSPVSELRTSEDIFVTPESKYYSPAAINSSLLTEDLSDEPPNQMTNWYLLSEEDTNTLPGTETHSYGANLKQLFPIICAVPDLSTISEISKENEDSQKSHFDTDRDTRKFDT